MADNGEMTEKLPSADAGAKTFKEAFAAARRQGNKQFTWQGKKYTTELASDKKASTSAPAVSGRPRGESVSVSPPKPAEAPKPVAPSAASATPTGIRRNPLVEVFGTEEARKRARAEPDVSREDIAAAKAAGDIRRERIAKQNEGVTNFLKRTFGTQAMREEAGMKKGGAVKKYAKGGAVSASKRGDGCAQRGKTKGRFV